MKKSTARHDLAALSQNLKDKGLFSNLDLRFAEFIGNIAHDADRELFLSAAIASRAAGRGNICVDLSLAFEELGRNGIDAGGAARPAKSLTGSPAVGKPGEYKPLILDDAGRLYLHRYWKYENALAEAIKARASAPDAKIDSMGAVESLGRLFPKFEDQKEPDRQKIAAAAALLKNFCVISGGPGTGKTTTVVKLLALLLEQSASSDLRIALAASTGKAAGRLQESIRAAKATLKCSEKIKEKIPEDARTVHRLLGSIENSPNFRHNAENPLPHDVVIVDEVSMVDLALMAKLFQAVRPKAKLILLGDRDQLASVEAGAVLGDLCDAGNAHAPSAQFSQRISALTGEKIAPIEKNADAPTLADCIAILSRSYRFGPNSGIGQAAKAVNIGDAEGALAIISDPGFKDISWKKLPPAGGLSQSPEDSMGDFAAALSTSVVKRLEPYLLAEEPEKAFEEFNRFRVLCAHRNGPLGVKETNRIIENSLRAKRLINTKGEWHHGRPVMATQNDYNLKLYNGDVGITLCDKDEDGALRVFFQGSDGVLRKFSPYRLPTCETVYAMTVHKSQGSEFDDVLMVLSNEPTRLISRELIYTGITRARTSIEIWASTETFISGVKATAGRTSGLRCRLWGD